MIAAPLLAWYDDKGRDLPWRKKGERQDPYKVWLSEIMLQQTTVVTVKPYYDKFLDRWPDVGALAAADMADVLAAWAGLGYYARARNLKKCAEAVVRDHGGAFPETEAALLTLPGVGPYTAAAIAAIAFDRKATVVDGNVERVISRLFALETPLPGAKPEIRSLAAAQTPDRRPGDYAQAMMDLGATVCTPRSPACPACPLRAQCRAERPEGYPKKSPKPPRPVRFTTAFVGLHDGRVLIRRRPEKGLLGGMMEVPCGSFGDEMEMTEPPFAAAWRPVMGEVVHVFTHFELRVSVQRADVELKPNATGDWAAIDRLPEAGLATLFRKIIDHALKA